MMRDRKGFGSVKRGRRHAWPLALAAVGTFLWVGASATPARADSNFERGFENELGRVLAREAVHAGKQVLFGAVVHPVYYGDHYDRYDRDHHHGRKHYRHPPGHAYGYRAKAHGYAPYRRVPVHTHEHGARPYRRGDRYGYYDGHRGKKWRKHKRHDRHHRHHDDCWDD